ncbi:MAG: DNA topoisomerase IB [Rhizobiaceae bacterium]|nr:DNA topoisomerase IB [Rhizobiaceae bacterium]
MAGNTATGSGGAMDAANSANQVSLIYVSDAEPGIRRRKRGKGFAYQHADGRPVRDSDTLDRIRQLAIPPAWTDVWICAEVEGHLQATGRDQRGRKQYRYHQRWSASRDDVKYSSLVHFARALPALRERLDRDLRKRELPLERVVASIVWLLDNTMIRVGNATYARDNKSFGLTTLRNRHVVVEGTRLRFAFKGKSGKEWNLKVTDRRMAKIIRSIHELPGQHLFQYLEEDGSRRMVRSQDVNAYIQEAIGSGFSSKHFRTWGGTVTAASLFAGTDLPDTKRERARAMNAVIDKVAGHLGNTRTVCRNCYIHPQIMKSWEEGHLAEEFALVRRSRRKPVEGLEDEEMLLLGWLEARDQI